MGWGWGTAHLLLLGGLQVTPLFNDVGKVHRAHGHAHLPDGIVLGEAVEVIHSHDQCAPTQLCVRDLWAWHPSAGSSRHSLHPKGLLGGNGEHPLCWAIWGGVGGAGGHGWGMRGTGRWGGWGRLGAMGGSLAVLEGAKGCRLEVGEAAGLGWKGSWKAPAGL